MKKITILFCLLLLGLYSFAQGSDFVGQKEFQERTKTLKSQVNKIKQTNSGLYKTVSNLETTVNKQALTITEAKTSIAGQADSIQAMKAKVAQMKDSFKNKSNDLLVLILGLFILLLFVLLSLRNACRKKMKEVVKELNETNNMLIDQGKNYDKKIADLSIELNSTNEKLKNATDTINKLLKEKE